MIQALLCPTHATSERLISGFVRASCSRRFDHTTVLDVPTPQEIAARATEIKEAVGDWYYVRTNPQHTRSVGERLINDWGVFAYVPLREERRLYGGERRRVIVPLVPGYVFACVQNDEQWYLLKRMPRVYGQPSLVINRERFVIQLASLAHRQAINPKLGLCQMPESGEKVRVIRGHYLGTVGTVIGPRAKMTRIAIFVQEVNGAYELEVDRDDIEIHRLNLPIPPAPSRMR